MTDTDEFLAHFGVKGMRWGVTRAANKTARAERRAANEHLANQAGKAAAAAKKRGDSRVSAERVAALNNAHANKLAKIESKRTSSILKDRQQRKDRAYNKAADRGQVRIDRTKSKTHQSAIGKEVGKALTTTYLTNLAVGGLPLVAIKNNSASMASVTKGAHAVSKVIKAGVAVNAVRNISDINRAKDRNMNFRRNSG